MSKARAGERIDALKRHDRPIRFEGDILARAFAPRQNPLNAPPVAIDSAPYVCLIVNVEWVSHVLGVLETLNQPDAWKGDVAEQDRSQNEIQRLLEMLMTGDACMVDPCCPETNDLLTEIKNINLEINNNLELVINNQTTIIDNDTTIIDQNDQIVVNNMFQQFNQYETVNQQYYQLNQMIYDGTPQSIAPNIGETWNEGGTDNTLCNAVKNYVDYAIYQRTNELNQDAYFVGVVSAAFVAAAIAGAAFTGGVSAIAGMVVAGVAGTYGAALSAWNTSVNDQNARRKVVCCMFDGLKDQNVTLETFQASVNDCGFDVGTNESNIAALVDGCNQLEYNFEAFLRLMNTSGVGSADECACDCDDDIALEDFMGTGCTITPMGNCIYRFTQDVTPNGIHYYASFRDIMLRCLRVEFADGYPQQGVSDNTSHGCCGAPDYDGVGGFAPTTLVDCYFRVGAPMIAYYKITLVDEEECE